jgi:hypothetical protein
MRLGTILAVATLSVIAIPKTVSAQCGAFSAGATCSRPTKPAIRADFGLQKMAPSAKTRKPLTATQAPATSTSAPVDCQMIKPIDPQFRSSMAVIQPAENVQLPMGVIHAPSCNR